MDSKEKLPQNEGPEMAISTDYRLWSLLFQDTAKKRPRRLTRAEAFFDLIQRQRMSMQVADLDIANGGFQELAQKWGWDRATVRRFLQSLSDIGVVSMTLTPQNRTVISLHGVTTVRQPQNNAGDSYHGYPGDSG